MYADWHPICGFFDPQPFTLYGEDDFEALVVWRYDHGTFEDAVHEEEGERRVIWQPFSLHGHRALRFETVGDNLEAGWYDVHFYGYVIDTQSGTPVEVISYIFADSKDGALYRAVADHAAWSVRFLGASSKPSH